jgi:hypothetical protein
MSQIETANPSAPHAIRLLWGGPLTVLASTAAVVLVQRLAVAVFTRPAGLEPTGRNLVQIELLSHSNEPAVFTAVLVSTAVVVFAVVCREAVNPFRTYRRIALVVLLVSFVPDVVAAGWALFGWPLATLYMVMHVVAWAVCVTMLTRVVT